MAALPISTDTPNIKGPLQGRWSYADWEELDHTTLRYEIINRVLYVTTAPSNFHQWVSRRLERFIGIPAEDQGLALSFSAPIGVLMPNCDPVQPDYVIILTEHVSIIHDRRIRGVPDVIIEILSPNNRAYDEETKRTAYAQAGVPEYVIINPAQRSLDHYRLPQAGRYGAMQTWQSDQTLTLACLPAVPIPVGELFAGSPDTTW